MDDLKVLQHARARLSEPHMWTKLAYARDADGNHVDASNEKATCFCLVGAMTGGGTPEEQYYARLTILTTLTRKGRHFGAVSEFNDDPNTTHADIIAVLDETIGTY